MKSTRTRRGAPDNVVEKRTISWDELRRLMADKAQSNEPQSQTSKPSVVKAPAPHVLPTRPAKPKTVAPPPLQPEPPMVPDDEIGVLEPPRHGAHPGMEKLFEVLYDRPAREAFGIFLKQEFFKRSMRWYAAAHAVGYTSQGQFYQVLRGWGYWRPHAFFALPGLLGMTEDAFVEASNLLPPSHNETAP